MPASNAPQSSVASSRWIPTTCAMCAYGCGIRVFVGDGIALKIEGDPTNPDNFGRLCPKGNAGLSRLYDPRRILKPMKRTNPQKGPDVDPGWVEIDWEEAYELVARELRKIREEDPRKLAYAFGDFHRGPLWGWGAAFGSPNLFSSLGNFCGGSYHPVNGMVHGTFSCNNDFNYCNYWIQIGAGDGFSSHMRLSGSAKRMADARMRGMKLVSIDPRCSVASSKADEWIPIIPGTDRAFVLGMAHVLVHELKMYDREFLRDRTNAPYLVKEDGYFLRDQAGKAQVWSLEKKAPVAWDNASSATTALEGTFTVDGKSVRTGFQVWSDTLTTHTPEAMAEVTSVPAETIRRIAREFVDAAQIEATIVLDGKTYPFRPAALNYYRGGQGHSDGFFNCLAFKLFNMLVGNIDVPGGHLGVAVDHHGNLIAEGEDGVLKPEPHRLLMPPFKYPPDSTHLFGWHPFGWQASHLNVETLSDPSRFGLEYPLEALVIIHSNPLWNLPANEQVQQIMSRMKFILAIDIHMTESTQWADIVLPDFSYLEQTSLFIIDNHMVTGHTVHQPVIEPLGDAKDAHEIVTELAKRIGFLDRWNRVLNSLGDLKPEYSLSANQHYGVEEFWDRIARNIYGDDHGLEWFKEHGHAVRLRTPEEMYWPYGKLRLPFYFEFVKRGGDALREQMKRAGITDWRFDDYCPLPFWKTPRVVEEVNQTNEFYAISFKEALHNFADTVVMPWLTEVSDKDAVQSGILVNSSTAQRLAIKSGDHIRLVSPVASVEGQAQVVEGIHPAVVGVSNATSRRTGKDGKPMRATPFNRLLPASLLFSDTVTGGMECTARVRIEKV